MSHSVQMDCEDSINQDLIEKTLFCICCLEQTGPYVILGTCAHREYLDSIPIPDLSPSIPDTVCCNCHDMLKKVTRFKLQVQQSFGLLVKKVDSLEKSRSFKTNLKISKTVHLNIPELIEHVKETPVTSEKVMKIKNIKTALEILNTNTRSLQSLTSYHNFIGLTETFLEATSHCLNFSSMGVPVPPESEIKKISSSHYGTAVLSVEIKKEPETEFVDEPIVSSVVNTDIESKETISNEHSVQEIKIETDLDTVREKLLSMAHNNHSYKSVISHKNPETQDVSEKDYSLLDDNELKHKENNDSKTAVSPIEDRMQCDDIVIVSTYGTAVLPDGIKHDPDDLDDSSSTIENCLGENRQKESNMIKSPTRSQILVNDGASLLRKRRPPSLCLIPIKLSNKALRDERQKKLNSSEFLQLEYRCRRCIIGFLFKENLDDHIKRKHVMKNPQSHVKCGICRQVVFRSDVREHKFRHYNRIECEKCKKRFVLFDEAFDHYRSVHSPLKNKQLIKRQLKTYWQSKRLQGNTTEVRDKTPEPETITTTTKVGSSTEFMDSLPET